MRTIRSKILIAMGWVMLISVIVLGFFGIPTGILLCALIGLAYGGYKQDKPFRLYSSIALIATIAFFIVFYIQLQHMYITVSNPCNHYGNKLSKVLGGRVLQHLDQEVLQMIVQTKNLLARLNATNITDSATRDALLRQMLGSIGKYSSIDINFHCECGKHIFIGDKVIINMNCTFLDDNIIKIGNNVLIAPNVQLYTATHPINANERFVNDWDERSGDLFFRTKALPITIEDNVWIGGGTIVLPGITIGRNSVIGAGSVVTKSIPTYSVAVGNPCRVIRELPKEDL